MSLMGSKCCFWNVTLTKWQSISWILSHSFSDCFEVIPATLTIYNYVAHTSSATILSLSSFPPPSPNCKTCKCWFLHIWPGTNCSSQWKLKPRCLWFFPSASENAGKQNPARCAVAASIAALSYIPWTSRCTGLAQINLSLILGLLFLS